MSVDWDDERAEINAIFARMIMAPTADGSAKRQAGLKMCWKDDPGHAGALYRHLNRWEDGDIMDKDSGVHTLIHAAWRCLAIAFQETHEGC